MLPPGVAPRTDQSASEALEAWIWEYVAPANTSERFGDWLRSDAQRERSRPATRAAELREGWSFSASVACSSLRLVRSSLEMIWERVWTP